MIRKTIKKVLAWLHLWLGLSTGVILIIVALTGSLLAFEDELTPVIGRHDHIVAVTSGARLTPDSILVLAQAVYPKEKANRLEISPEANRSVEVRFGGRGEGKRLFVVFIDPYTGAVLSKGEYEKQFFQQVRSLHRYLLMGSTGKIITGISCTICFFLVISGLVIWWPANKNAMKQRFKIKWNGSGKRLTWDLHAVSGFYLSIFLFMITLTGLVWSYDSIEDLIYKLADGKVKQETKIKNLDKGKKSNPGVYESMLEQVNAIYPYEGKVAFAIPAKPEQAMTLQKDNTISIVPTTDAAYFDSNTGKFIKQIPFGKLSLGAKIRKMIFPVHTGSLLGWPTKLMALIVALFTASLPITGFLIWWGKKKKKGPAKKTVKPALAI